MPQHKHTAPGTVEGACSLLSEYGSRAAVYSGGQSLMPKVRRQETSQDVLVDINNIQDADYIETESGQVRIGCLARHADVVESETVREANPTLGEAVATIGDVQVRNRGTLCGAVATAAPAGDPPVLAALFDADIVATSTDGDTVYDGRSFYEGGSTELGETELIREVRFPALGPDEGAAYEKWKPAGCAWPVATVGAYLSTSGGTVEEARLYTGALEGEPREMADSAGVIEGEPPEEGAVLDAATRLGEDAEPMADADGSVEFKRELSKKLAKDALEAAASRAGV
jgi:carbon-monoxide dehydrogenase medium subunit